MNADEMGGSGLGGGHKEQAMNAQGLSYLAFDKIGDAVAFWECEACGAGFHSLHSGFWCRHCGSIFKNPQRYAGSKKRMAVFKPGEKMTFDLREKILEYGREQQAAWERRGNTPARQAAKAGRAMG